jgi:adenylate kinase
MRLILLGAPGAGKGTQGVRLADHYGVAHVASGDILRAHVAEGTPLGRQVAAFVAEGELVPDDLVLAVVGRAVGEAMETGGYLLDGFPRTLAQAERAYALAKEGDITADAVLFLDVPDDVAVDRLVDRSATSGRVDDASTDVIRHRLEVFHAQTYPLLDFYRQNDRLVTIDAGAPPDEVFASIVKTLDDRLGPR